MVGYDAAMSAGPIGKASNGVEIALCRASQHGRSAGFIPGTHIGIDQSLARTETVSWGTTKHSKLTFKSSWAAVTKSKAG